jgi:hypothetical protein
LCGAIAWAPLIERAPSAATFFLAARTAFRGTIRDRRDAAFTSLCLDVAAFKNYDCLLPDEPLAFVARDYVQ